MNSTERICETTSIYHSAIALLPRSRSRYPCFFEGSQYMSVIWRRSLSFGMHGSRKNNIRFAVVIIHQIFWGIHHFEPAILPHSTGEKHDCIDYWETNKLFLSFRIRWSIWHSNCWIRWSVHRWLLSPLAQYPSISTNWMDTIRVMPFSWITENKMQRSYFCIQYSFNHIYSFALTVVVGCFVLFLWGLKEHADRHSKRTRPY
jgi:hypothetical protein